MTRNLIFFAALFSLLPAIVLFAAESNDAHYDFQKVLQKAEAGDAEAQFTIGLMYTHGEGVSQDHRKAFEWCQKAAKQGLRTTDAKMRAEFRHNHFKKSAFGREPSKTLGGGLTRLEGKGPPSMFGKGQPKTLGGGLTRLEGKGPPSGLGRGRPKVLGEDLADGKSLLSS